MASCYCSVAFYYSNRCKSPAWTTFTLILNWRNDIFFTPINWFWQSIEFLISYGNSFWIKKQLAVVLSFWTNIRHFWTSQSCFLEFIFVYICPSVYTFFVWMIFFVKCNYFFKLSIKIFFFTIVIIGSFGIIFLKILVVLIECVIF